MNCYCGHTQQAHDHGPDGLGFCLNCTCDIYETDEDPPAKMWLDYAGHPVDTRGMR